MKKTISTLLILLIESGITYGIAWLTHVRFIEVMFFTGLVFLVISMSVSGAGNLFGNATGSEVSAQTGILQEREEFNWKGTHLFYVTLLFFGIGLILFGLLIGNVIPPAS